MLTPERIKQIRTQAYAPDPVTSNLITCPELAALCDLALAALDDLRRWRQAVWRCEMSGCSKPATFQNSAGYSCDRDTAPLLETQELPWAELVRKSTPAGSAP